MTKQIYDWGFSVRNRHVSWIRDMKGWTEGSIATEHGIVSVYSQGYNDNRDFTRLDLVHDGYCHCRSIKGKRYSHRGLITQAKRFASEIVGGQGA